MNLGRMSSQVVPFDRKVRQLCKDMLFLARFTRRFLKPSHCLQERHSPIFSTRAGLHEFEDAAVNCCYARVSANLDGELSDFRKCSVLRPPSFPTMVFRLGRPPPPPKKKKTPLGSFLDLILLGRCLGVILKCPLSGGPVASLRGLA